jgi:hypothetical protein
MATFENKKNRAIINRINELVRDIRELEAVIKEIRTSGYSSASLSSAGGSKSYTRQDINTLTSELSRLKIELREARSLLEGSSLIRRIRA